MSDEGLEDASLQVDQTDRQRDQATPKVFVSYARRDRDFVDRLASSLTAMGLHVAIDRNDIATGEDWKSRLDDLIIQSDVVLFVMTDASLSSPVCGWEVDRCRELGKRLIPLAHGKPSNEPPAHLRTLNYVFSDAPGGGAATPEACTDAALSSIKSAILTDIERVRLHTRLTERAEEWQSAIGEIKDEFLLSPAATRTASELLANWPRGVEAMPLLNAFIEDSIASVEFSRRVVMVRGVKPNKRLSKLERCLEEYGFSLHVITHATEADAARAIRFSPATIMPWTDETSSEEALRELATLAKMRGTLIHLLLSASIRPPIGFGELQALSLSTWNGKTADVRFQDLVIDLQTRLFTTPRRVPKAPIRLLYRRLFLAACGLISLLLAGWAISHFLF